MKRTKMRRAIRWLVEKMEMRGKEGASFERHLDSAIVTTQGK